MEIHEEWIRKFVAQDKVVRKKVRKLGESVPTPFLNGSVYRQGCSKVVFERDT